MRVGLVIYGSLDTLSGGYLYDRQFVEALRRADAAVEVLSLPWRRYGRLLLDNFSPGVARRLQGAGMDLMVQDELNHPSLFLLNRRLRRQGGPPIVAIVHHLRSSEPHPRPLRAFYRWVEQRYLVSVQAFIFNGPTTRRVVERRLGRPVEGVVAVPGRDHLPPHPEPDWAARARRQGPLRVLFVANLIPRKGLHTLLAALACLPRDRWRLTVVGSPEVDRGYVRRLRRWIRARNLEGQVRFLGALPGAQVAAQMERADVLAVPSAYEGFGIVYLEAMGHGLPVIAGARGGAQDVVEEGVTGFLVPPEDSAALAERLAALLSEPERRVAMGRAGRAHFLAHPTWAESLAPAVAFLRGLAAAAGFSTQESRAPSLSRGGQTR